MTSDNIVEAAVKALRDGVHGYTPAPGLASLREAVSERYYEEFGMSIDPNNVLITPGAKPVLFIVASMLGVMVMKFYILILDFQFTSQL